MNGNEKKKLTDEAESVLDNQKKCFEQFDSKEKYPITNIWENYDEYAGLAAQNKFMLEFLVIVDKNFPLQAEDKVMLYLENGNDSTKYVMHFDERLNAYRFSLEQSEECCKYTYKYFVIQNEDIDIWEILPDIDNNSISNRQKKIKHDLLSNRHVLFFDVAVFDKFNNEVDYIELTQNYRLQYLIFLRKLVIQDKSAIIIALNLYKQWVNTYFTPIVVAHQYIYHVCRHSSRTKNFNQTRLLENSKLDINQIDSRASLAQRVLHTLCLLLALNYMKVDFKECLKIHLCFGLCMKDCNADDMLFILNQVNFMKETFIYNQSIFNQTFNFMIDDFGNIPHILLILPLFNLIKKSEVSKEPPNFPNSPGLKLKLRNSEEDQRHLLELCNPIYLLSQEHPWIVKYYFDFLNLKSVAKVLNEDLAPCINATLLLPKLHYFWKQLNTHSKEMLSDEIVVVMCTFISEEYKSNLTRHQGGDQRVLMKIDASYILDCFSYFFKILKEIKFHSLKHEFLSYPGLAQTLRLCDGIIECAHELVEKEQILKLQDEILSALYTLLQSKKVYSSSSIIMLWNLLSKVQWSNSDFREKWNKKLNNHTKNIILSDFPTFASLIDFYCDQLKFGKPNEKVTEWFTDVVQEEFMSMIYSEDRSLLKKGWNTLRTLIGLKTDKIFEFLSKVLTKQLEDCPRYENGQKESFILFAANWNTMFMDTLYEKNLINKLPKATQNELDLIEKDVHKVMDDVNQNHITVECLKTFLKSGKGFQNFVKTFWTRSTPMDSLFNLPNFFSCLDRQFKSLCEFDEHKVALKNYCSFLKHILSEKVQLRFDGLDDKLKKDVSDLPLNALVSFDENGTNFPFFKWPREALNNVLQINHQELLPIHTKGVLKMAANVVDDLIAEGLTEINILETEPKVWKALVKKVNEFLLKIDEGDIFLQDLHQIFAECDVNNHQKLNEEMISLLKIVSPTFNNKKLKDHVKKVHNSTMLKQNLRLAECLKQVKEVLNLNGDFKDFLSLLDLADTAKKQKLSSIDENIERINSHLADATKGSYNLQTLEDFIRCEDLIVWLKENIKEAKQVKNMTDLVMTVAGGKETEIEKASCFNTSVVAFSPFLFDLAPTDGFSKLLDTCKTVWKKVENDKSILKKWSETGKRLGWLKNVQVLQGSIEKSSLEKVEEINSTGFYKIKTDEDVLATIENSLKVYSNAEPAEMTFIELTDLQSKLMLFAGENIKGREEVSKFMNILSSVKNLVNTYVQLKNTGCPLFKDWMICIHCANEKTGHVTVEVYFGETCQSIPSNKSITEELDNLTTVLDEALSQWVSLLETIRTKYYFLNYFNMKQLNYICNELGSHKTNDFTDQLYQLLAGIAPKANFEKISACLNEATKTVTESYSDGNSSSQVNENLPEVEMKLKAVDDLMNMELSEELAKAAVEAIGYHSLDDCLLWALDPESDVQELVDKFDDEIGLETSNSNVQVIHNVVVSKSDSTLKDLIAQMLSDYNSKMPSMGTVVKTVCERYFKGTAITSLKECLCLEHCGKFLHNLAKDYSDRLPCRQWPINYTEGKPNLVICRNLTDVLTLILSLYLYSPQQPFPSVSEVLICSEETSFEEVELLLKRAILKQENVGERIYCLAQADLLSIDIAKKVEECYERLLQSTEANKLYRLVIFTCSNQNYLTSLFYEHKTDGFIADDVAIKDYIKEHLSLQNFDKVSAAVNKDVTSVTVVKSERSGMGKSLYISRCYEKAQKLNNNCKCNTIRLLKKHVNANDVVDLLCNKQKRGNSNLDCHFVHIDITPCVMQGQIKLMFDLFILGIIQNSQGIIWSRQLNHLYMIEYSHTGKEVDSNFEIFLDFFPSVSCLSPLEVKHFFENNPGQHLPSDQISMDNQLLLSDVYQRPFQYLRLFSSNESLSHFLYENCDGNVVECLSNLLKYCKIENPTWAELFYFSQFLNTHLQDCEKSEFSNTETIVPDAGFKGFKRFVVQFVIRMSQDFATPSLNVDDNSDDDFKIHQLQRRWKNGFNPYLFFNYDRVSVTFVNFNVNKQGDLRHSKTEKVIERSIMPPSLVPVLAHNGANFKHDVDSLSRIQKLALLSEVFGVDNIDDPDPSYELTTDNVVKMLAIEMRFRCGIPVVMIGETGCGKTRMIEFMSKLKAGRNKNVRNMLIVKVHGGVTAAMVQEKVLQAVELAKNNQKNNVAQTILFLDEANTTEAIYAVKEIVSDRTVCGKSFQGTGLEIVAACNPYRPHDKETIKKMANSALGFHVKKENVSETIGGYPMRHLVYRVICLPPSLLPLVWDFGQLSSDVEEMYIKQMVLKIQVNTDFNQKNAGFSDKILSTIISTIAASQEYMRERKDVCCFVSLRDAERTIQSFKWFYEHMPLLYHRIKEEKERCKWQELNLKFELTSLIQAVSICYHATLPERSSYRDLIAKLIGDHCQIAITGQNILDEIIACQNVFLNAIDLESNIACNDALRENVFMMIVCIEMRIPLFLVGKPGSSKSLAKTIVTDAMQGRNSTSDLFQKLKEIHALSFQCSAVTDASGIEAVFFQCVQLQKDKDCNKFVATVILDEIGLAEDSEKMPLKILHPLLETASTSSFLNDKSSQKVGFVGISNWALDPAKMNRGIFVTREVPTCQDLLKTAEAIFHSETSKLGLVRQSIKILTDAYMEVYEKQDQEFFGLRDYYALLKTLYSLLEKNPFDLENNIGISVVQNFGGQATGVLKCFQNHCRKIFDHFNFPCISIVKLLYNNLNSDFKSRFLLLLTEQYSAVNLLSELLKDRKHFVVIFGSSFPHDQDYAEVCRNINKIKVCMGKGQTVVLLNLRDLYESLYDTLNQYYLAIGTKWYVDLGLGGHRVKSLVSPEFRLIVIEEKKVVYNEYPIPLINRLEKHVFEMGSMVTPAEAMIVQKLKSWVSACSEVSYGEKMFDVRDTFVGYNDDTCASVVLSTTQKTLEESQKALLRTSSIDGVCRLLQSNMQSLDSIFDIYMKEQVHDSLMTFLQKEMKHESVQFFEVLSFSQILNSRDKMSILNQLEIIPRHLMLLTLQEFQTELQFSNKIDQFLHLAFTKSTNSHFVLLIQCSQAHLNSSLVACAKYTAMNKIQQYKTDYPSFNGSLIVCFLLAMERQTKNDNSRQVFTTFYSKNSSSVFIDELKPNQKPIAPVNQLWGMAISEIFQRDGDLVDIKILIQESIQKAMAKLKNHNTDLVRNRVQLLNKLCFQDQSNSTFYKALVKKIIYLLKDRESKFLEERWIVQQACSLSALQEGGTFKNVLWLHSKNVVAFGIAKIIGVADADNNLDLIEKFSNENRRLLEVWFQFFYENNLWDLQWSTVNTESLNDIFHVEGHFGFTCSFPFSRLLFEFLKKEWLLIQEIKASDYKEHLLKKISGSSLQRLLDISQEIGLVACKLFLHDLVHLVYKPRSVNARNADEFEMVEEYFLNLFEYQKSNTSKNINALVLLFTLVAESFKDLQLLSEIINIYPDVMDKNKLLEKCSVSNDFTLHTAAFECLVTKLAEIAQKNFDTVEKCKNWKLKVVQTKQLSRRMLSTSSSFFHDQWNRIVFVEMFLEELLPIEATEEITKNYLKSLSKEARLLWRGSQVVESLSCLKFLRIVETGLQRCTNDIQLYLLCDWKDIKCWSCKKIVKKPVLLPCNHWFCMLCLGKNVTTCPFCQKEVDHLHSLKPKQLTLQQQEEFEMLKQSCTSFFLEYLSTLCYPSNQDSTAGSPEKEIGSVLKEFVVSNDKTKPFSPLHCEIDRNPTARSYILQLLLHYNEDLVEQQLEEHFRDMEQVLNDPFPLMEIYIQCKQDLLKQNRFSGQNTGSLLNVEFAYHLLKLSLQLLNGETICSQLTHLRICANLQFVAKSAACVVNDNSVEFQKKQRFIKILIDKYDEPKFLIFKSFFIKWLCRQFGIDAFDQLIKSGLCKKLVPEYLLAEANQNNKGYLHSDKFSLTGKTYLQAKALLVDITQQSEIEKTMPKIISYNHSFDDMVQILLSLSLWTACRKEDSLRQQAFNNALQHFKVKLQSQESLQFFIDITKGTIHDYCSTSTNEFNAYAEFELIVHFGTVLRNSKNVLSQMFQQMISNPSDIVNLFLPTMPGTDFSSVQAALGHVRLYLCPNNHPYYIGECLQPMEQGKCSTCGATIGGIDHKVEAGNQPGEITEQSQAGYRIRSTKTVGPERKLTRLSVCATRICLHISMILGFKKHQVPKRDLNFPEQDSIDLLKLIKIDLAHLAGFLGCSVDNACIILHLCFNMMRKSQNCLEEKYSWNNMKDRENWEAEFQSKFLAPIFSNACKNIEESQIILIQAGKLSDRPLERLVYELKEDEDEPAGIVPWYCPRLWKYKIHVGIKGLIQKLEVIDGSSNDDGSALKAILNQDQLGLIQDLSTILAVQKEFLKKYQQKIDMKTSDELTIEEFLKEENFHYNSDIDKYIQIWNKVKEYLLPGNIYQVSPSYFEEEMSFESPVSMCLPCKRGRGVCALRMVEYLIDKQNTILYQCRERVKVKPSLRVVDVRDIVPNDLIKMNSLEDLMPLILENSQYETEIGDHGLIHNITYNLGLLQKKILQKFFFGKALIRSETIPLMKYPQDMGLADDFKTVQENHQQDQLPMKLIQNVDALTEKSSTPKLCELFRTLTLLVQFLAKEKKVNPKRTLLDYSEKELLIPFDETEMIPRSALMCHCLALYERMSWHRSKRLLQIGQNPFENIFEEAEDITDDNLLNEVKEMLMKMHESRLQFELNSLIMVGPTGLNVEWSLSDVLLAYLDGKNDDDHSWCEMIPTDVHYKHAVHIFLLSMDNSLKKK